LRVKRYEKVFHAREFFLCFVERTDIIGVVIFDIAKEAVLDVDD